MQRFRELRKQDVVTAAIQPAGVYVPRRLRCLLTRTWRCGQASSIEMWWQGQALCLRCCMAASECGAVSGPGQVGSRQVLANIASARCSLISRTRDVGLATSFQVLAATCSFWSRARAVRLRSFAFRAGSSAGRGRPGSFGLRKEREIDRNQVVCMPCWQGQQCRTRTFSDLEV